jgi:glycosyltransferase involved in cell wall biosynthesis
MEANAYSVVLVHDWLIGMRGGEKCLEAACRHWPQAPIFSLLHKAGSVSSVIESRPIRTSWLQRLPGVERYYRYLLPLIPAAVRRWRLPPCDLVLSFSHCAAKGVSIPPGAIHVCYCFTPMRYAWHMQQAYFGRSRRPMARLRDRLLRRLREWDRATAKDVTHFIAISQTVRQRIADCYGRSSVVIYPPVDAQFFCTAPVPREDYYLAVSAFAPYKRLDLAIEACRLFRRRLVVIGIGQDAKRLRRLAGPEVHFLGWQPNEVIRDHLRRCRALLFPGEEDFGIVPLEAQACGTPVIAYGRGGATETVIRPGLGAKPTGLWFEEQTPDSLIAAMVDFEQNREQFLPSAARQQALRFRAERFESELFDYLDSIMQPAAARRAA